MRTVDRTAREIDSAVHSHASSTPRVRIESSRANGMERVRRMGKPYRPKDHYFQRAKQRGFRARSAFKLEELVERFSLLRPGARVLDLGAAPGGFLQVIARTVGPSGLAVGVDLVPLRPFTEAWVRTAVVDVLADDAQAKIEAVARGPYDTVLS